MTEMLTQGARLGDNELILRIGRGGMATVWVARQPRAELGGHRLVAVKAMLGELAGELDFVSMFLDEVRLVRSIRHVNVVDVYDVGETDGIMWMSMEWVEGESLHAMIAEAGKRRAIPPEMAVRIIADAASGLHAAHELKDAAGALRGVVHRDVSPHNILIGTNGVVKLVDFGVAKALGRTSESTQVGQLKGKFGYMSPEQALGKSVDRRSDVFALGIVLFEVTTSRRLFRGESDVETLKLVTRAGIPRPSTIDPSYPPALERIVLRALERDPERRYASAAEFAYELNAFLKAEHVVVPQAGIAALLKKVVGERIEQRRKAVRAALKVLSNVTQQSNELLPSDPVFTPTGKEQVSASGMSAMTGSGGLESALTASGLSAANGSSKDEQSSNLSRPRPELSWMSLLGYAVGVTGLAIALFVLLLAR